MFVLNFLSKSFNFFFGKYHFKEKNFEAKLSRNGKEEEIKKKTKKYKTKGEENKKKNERKKWKEEKENE